MSAFDRYLMLALLCAGPVSLSCWVCAAPAETLSADQDEQARAWAEVQALMRQGAPRDVYMKEDSDALEQWQRAHYLKLRASGWRYYRHYPDDPRRWEVAAALLEGATDSAWAVAEGDGDDADSWPARLRHMQLALSQSEQAGALARERGDAALIDAHLQQAQRGEYPADMARIQERIDALAARFPHGQRAPLLQLRYLGLLHERRPAAVVPLLERLQGSANQGIRWAAGGFAQRQRLRDEPLQLKFVALDGRRIDLEALRGKVVLLEFWATWCKPCIKQIPEIKRVYAEYHAQGFEVIGVSMDQQHDRGKLERFVEREQIPWPQHFDGQGQAGSLAQRFAVRALPATLLLDTTGRLARAEPMQGRLAVEVEHLLNAAQDGGFQSF